MLAGRLAGQRAAGVLPLKNDLSANSRVRVISHPGIFYFNWILASLVRFSWLREVCGEGRLGSHSSCVVRTRVPAEKRGPKSTLPPKTALVYLTLPGLQENCGGIWPIFGHFSPLYPTLFSWAPDIPPQFSVGESEGLFLSALNASKGERFVSYAIYTGRT